MDKFITEFIAIALLIAVLLIENKVSKEVRRIKEENKAKTEALAALHDVIHEMWKQDTVYFHDTIMMTPAFIHADTVLEGDWEDTFLPWASEQ